MLRYIIESIKLSVFIFIEYKYFKFVMLNCVVFHYVFKIYKKFNLFHRNNYKCELEQLI